MSETKCGFCAQTVGPGRELCGKCENTLEVALGNISTYYDDLATVREKRTRYSGNATKGSIGKAQPLPVDGRFLDPVGAGSQAAWDTRNTVTTWARIVLEEHPPIREQAPKDTIASVCGWLGSQRGWIAGQMWATDMLDEMLDIERRLRRIVDRPADAWYAGECGSETDMEDAPTVVCHRELYATPGSAWVRCSDCGCEYDVEARRKTLLTEAEDREVTVRLLARIVTTLGTGESSEAVLENRINVWVHRGRLQAHGSRVVNGRPAKTYRVGDVLDLLSADAQGKPA